MGYLIQQGSTTRPLVFLLVQSSDHITGLTGAAPTVTIRKNNASAAGSFITPTGTVREIGSGWYQVDANATDNGTLGPLLLHATAASADPVDDRFEVVAFNPDVAFVPNAAAGSAGGLWILGANAAANTTLTGTAASGSTPATAALTLTGGAASTTGGGVASPAITATGGAGAASTNGAAIGVQFIGGGTNTVASNAHGFCVTGTSTGSGLCGTSGGGATGDGITATAASTNGNGFKMVSTGTGSGFLTDKLTASGAVAFQSTFAVTTSTALGAISGSTLTLSGAVAFQSTFTVTGAVAFSSTFAVTTSTSLAALSCTTLTASGAVAFQSTFAVTTSTALGAISGSTLTLSGAVAFQSTFTITGATTHTGNVSMAAGLNITQSSANTAALVVTGNGSGNGATFTGGAAVTTTPAGAGISFVGGSASTGVGGVAGAGLSVLGGAGAASTNGSAVGFVVAAGGTTTVSGNDAATFTGTGNGNGVTFAHAGSGKDFNATTTPLTLAKTTNITGFNDITAAAAATGVWQDTTSGDFTVAGSIGKSLFTSGNAPGAASGLALVGSAMTLTAGEETNVATAVWASGTRTLTAFSFGVNVTSINSVSTSSVTAVNANIGQTQPVNFTGTGASALVKSDAVDIAGTAAATELVAAVWDSAISGHTTGGTFGGALNAAGSAGDPWATLIPGAYGAGTAGHRLGNIPDIAAGSAGGLFIAGSNAATTVNFTGNLSGSVGSVTGLTNATIATAVWTDTTASDFTTLTSPGKIIFAQLGGAFTTTSSSVFTVAALANAPTGGSAPTVSQIATGVWQDLTSSGDFGTAGSIGALLKLAVPNAAPGASGGVFIAGTNAATTVNITGNLSGSVGSVTSGVTVTTNNDKTGYSLTQTFPTNFSSLAITVGGAVTVGTNNDKTGYSLTQAFPANFSALGISAGGAVSEVTLVDTLTTYTGNTPQTGDAYGYISSSQTEPGQNAPPVSASLRDKISYLYKAWRNKKTQTATTFDIFADGGVVVDQTSTVSDDSVTTTIGQIVSGP